MADENINWAQTNEPKDEPIKTQSVEIAAETDTAKRKQGLVGAFKIVIKG